jgi:rod shape-determining protein MreC
MTSVQIKRTSHFGTVQWDGANPEYINMLYVPRHVQPLVGDTIVTSGYNAIYPEGILVGTIAEVKLKDEALFYALKVKLSQDFRKLTYVAVVKSTLKIEQEMLEQTIEE